jgi:hypothetical protein
MHLFKRRIRASQPRITGINLLSSHSLTHSLNHAYVTNLLKLRMLERLRSSKAKWPEKRMGKGPLKKEVDKSMPQVPKLELTWYLRY